MSAMVSSNKTSQHNLNSDIYHTDPPLLMHFLHTVKTDHFCHAQYSNYIAATHITHSPCSSKCTTHPPLSTPLHIHHFLSTLVSEKKNHRNTTTRNRNTTLQGLMQNTVICVVACLPQPFSTNKHKAYLCKWWQNGTRCRDGVKVLWCHSHLVWLVFEASIPTSTCFHSENFCDL